MGVFLGVMLNVSSLRITPKIRSLIAELDEFKGAWATLRTLAPKRLPTLLRAATIESIGSSARIEGSNLTDREVEQLLSNLEKRTFDTQNAQEVGGYELSMALIFHSWEEFNLSEENIKKIHFHLLRCDRYISLRSQYKTTPNSMRIFVNEGMQSGTLTETATPSDTPRLMMEAVDWASKCMVSKQLHPLLVTAIFIIIFLRIYPFPDSNGQLSRILITLLLLRAGYAYVPYSSLERVFEQRFVDYHSALQRTLRTMSNSSPDWQPWVLFFLRALNQQMKRLARNVETEKIVVSSMPRHSVRIVEYAREHGRVTIGDFASSTGTSRNTLKPHFRHLVERKHLVMHGDGRGAWYALP